MLSYGYHLYRKEGENEESYRTGGGLLYEFYRKVGQQAGGIPVEQVMGDVLFKLAGELSLNAIDKQARK